ncbi:MAG: prolipoprotein diacylglyceryl transferase, partial [Candidatus Cloacimonadota bacterium]|nr:prolipoprotein diacylglyceryl transferase [Candidatus Cloacimonadota bacterium]
MLVFPNISPEIFRIGPVAIRWYGLMYVIAIIIGHIFIKKILRKENIEMKNELYENFIFYIMLGVIIGGRLGYILFYDLPFAGSIVRENFLNIFATWKGGMSFHGGAIGVITAGITFSKKYNYSFYHLADITAPFITIGLGLGRLGNFINAELYGRVTDVPWGMIFPGETQPRHPSQIYELLLEGVLLTIILFAINKKKPFHGSVFWTMVGLYGIFRIFVEQFRQPDNHIGFLFSNFTMGQFLSTFMILSSIVAIMVLWKHNADKINI